jgi:hypothetical protein
MATNGVGAFFKAVKMTSVRCLLLLVGLGLSITAFVLKFLLDLTVYRVKLHHATSVAIAIVTTGYFVFETIYEYKLVSQDSGEPINGILDLLSLIGLFITDVIFWIWVCPTMSSL